MGRSRLRQAPGRCSPEEFLPPQSYGAQNPDRILAVRCPLRSWLDSPASLREIGADALEPLFVALADTQPAPDAALPDTDVGLEMERWLSPPFVRGERYGTRCSTIVLVEAGAIVFAERRFGPDGVPQGDSFAVLPRRG